MADQRQLDIETQINEAIKARAALLDGQKTLIADQIALAQELCRAIECQELDGYNERIKETREGLLAASDATQELDDSNKDMERNLRKSSKTMNFFKGAALGAAVAIKNGFGLAFKVVRSLGSFVKTGLVGAFKIVKFAMAGWSKMLGNIAQKGMEAANAGIGLRNAYENVKHTFGGLASTEGKAVTGVFDKMRGSMSNVAGTGISFAKIFGRGPDGLAAGLDYVAEIAEGMGPGFERMAEGFVEAADEVVILGRSLGFTGEDFAQLGIIAGHTGETMKETLGRLSREITTVSKNLGVNSKVMADNLKIMMKQPLVFGTSTKEMIKASVAAQKLGVSIEQLQGPMSVFDDFEGAATAAADLAAEFGVVVDATEMMTAEPAEQFQMLKDAIAASGQSFEDMSRQEKKRLAELSGMDPQALFAAMDPTNAFDGDAAGAMEQGVDAATKATMDQTAATQQLAKSMKQLHEAMEPMNTSGGFFGTFIEGLQTGFMRSDEGREIMNKVLEAFTKVRQAGLEVGRMLGELFRPGAPLHFLMEYFRNLPVRMEEMMVKVKAAFRQFVTEFSSGGEAAQNALANLLGNLKDAIFGDQGGVGAALLDGFHKLGDLILANIINLVPYILEGLITAFQMAINLMNGESPGFGLDLGDNAILPMTRAAFEKLMSNEVVTEFGSKFMEMISLFWDNYGDKITALLGKLVKGVIVAAVMQAMGPMIIGGLIKTAIGAIGPALARLAPGPSPGPGGPGGGGGLRNMAKSVRGAVKELAKIKLSDLGKAIIVLGLMGGAFGLAVLGIAKMSQKIVDMGVDMKAFAITSFAFGMVAGIAVAVGGLLKVMKTVNPDPKTMLTATAVLGVVGILFVAVMHFAVEAVKELNTIQVSEGLNEAAEAAGSIAMTGLKVTAGVAAIALGLGIIMSLGPVVAGAIALAFVGAAIVFKAAMGMVVSAIKSLTSIDANKAEGAVKAAQAGSIMVETTLLVVDKIWAIMKDIKWDEDKFLKILGSIEKIVHSLRYKFMPTVLEMAAMVTGDPQIIKDKISVVTMVIDAFAPITNLYASAMKMNTNGTHRVSAVLNKLNDGLQGMLTGMQNFVRTIVQVTSGMTPQQIKSAAAVAPLLESMANLMTAIIPAQAMFENQLGDIDRGFRTDRTWAGTTTTKDLGTKTGVLKQSWEKQSEYITTVVNLLQQIKIPLVQLVKAVAGITFTKNPKDIEKNMKVIGSVMEAVASAAGGFSQMTNLLKDFSSDADRKEGEISAEAITRLTNMIQNIKMTLAGGGMFKAIKDIITVAQIHFGKMGPEIPKLLENVATYIDGVARLLSAVSPLKTFVPDAVAAMNVVPQLKEVFTTQAVEPIVQMVEALTYLDEQTSEKLSNLPAIDAIMEKVGDKLQVKGNGELVVTREPVNIEIKFNVHLEAKDIAKALVEAELVQKGSDFDDMIRMEQRGA